MRPHLTAVFLLLGCGNVSVVARESGSPGGLAVDSASVYWGMGPSVKRIPVAGGKDAFLDGTWANPVGFALTSDALYVADTGDSKKNVLGAVKRVPLDGGKAETLATTKDQPFSIAVDGDAVYWVTAGAPSPGALMRLDLDGGTPRTLLTADVGRITIDRTSVYWVGNDGLMRLPLMGGTPEAIAPGDGLGGGAVAVDSKAVYWTRHGTVNATGTGYDNGGLMRVPLGGGSAEQLATLPHESGGDVIVDATSVYWTSEGAGLTGSLRQLRLSDRSEGTIYSSDELVLSLTQTADALYWLSPTASVVTAPKPR